MAPSMLGASQPLKPLIACESRTRAEDLSFVFVMLTIILGPAGVLAIGFSTTSSVVDSRGGKDGIVSRGHRQRLSHSPTLRMIHSTPDLSVWLPSGPSACAAADFNALAKFESKTMGTNIVFSFLRGELPPTRSQNLSGHARLLRLRPMPVGANGTPKNCSRSSRIDFIGGL